MEAREILCEFSERASKYTINLNGRIRREQEPYTRGGNAFVYHGTLSPWGTTVAIKTALGVPQADKKTIKKMLREAHVWSKLDHPNVLPLLGITTDFDLTVSLVSTWMEKGSARYYVQKRHNDPRAIIRDIAEGLSYLHSHPKGPIIHGDLKGDNVLIAEDGRALLTDFGLSIHFNSSFAMTVNPPRGGSLHWMAPELVDAQNGMLATIESDIWSFGMTTLELFTGKTPYNGLVTAIVQASILRGPPERPSDEDTCSRMSEEWWTLCTRCWAKEPPSRISMSDTVELTGQLLTAVIAIMGPTGSGKSNFINKLTGSAEESGADTLKSCTQGIREFTVNVAGGKRYVFVDTPGFDDTHRSDRDILRTIAEWLEEKYRGDVKLTGVIYTHRISDNRLSGSVCKNLDLFARLCGDNAAQCVRLVTTMWDTEGPNNKPTWQNRVSQLKENLWKPLISLGARHEQFFNTRESAWSIVDELVQACTSRKLDEASTGRPFLIQEEMVDARKKFNETSAGKALYSRLQRTALEYQETLAQLEDAIVEKDPAAATQLRAEHDKTKAELEKVIKDIEGMKIPLWRRFALLFVRKKPRSRKIELNVTQAELDELRAS